MRLAIPIPFLAISASIMILVSLPCSVVHAIPSPEPSLLADMDQQMQQQQQQQKQQQQQQQVSVSRTAQPLSEETELHSQKQRGLTGGMVDPMTSSSRLLAGQPLPSPPKLASPLDVLSYATTTPDARQEMLQQQQLRDKLQLRPFDYLPHIPGVLWPPGMMSAGSGGQISQSGSTTKRAVAANVDYSTAAAAAAAAAEELLLGDDLTNKPLSGSASGGSSQEDHGHETEKRDTSGSSGASSSEAPPGVDPEMTCYLDREKPGVVFCSNGKVYAYYNPSMDSRGGGAGGGAGNADGPGSAGPQMQRFPRLLKRIVSPAQAQFGAFAQPFQPGPVASHDASNGPMAVPFASGYQPIPTKPSQHMPWSYWEPATPQAQLGNNKMYKRRDWSPSSTLWDKKDQQWGKGKPMPNMWYTQNGGGKSWYKRSLETDSGMGIASPLLDRMYYQGESVAPMFGAGTETGAGIAYGGPMKNMLLQQQYQQDLQQHQLALQRQQQQAALVRSQLIQNLIATQPMGVASVGPDSFSRLEKRQAMGGGPMGPAAATAINRAGGVRSGLQPGQRVGGTYGSGVNVIPVPIDIALLTTPDGDLTLLPPDFEPSQVGRMYGGGFGRAQW
ncbi:hypothetical protein BGW42_000209 [Actinomortierella wolfii]|nr:hypothetical protein BGW42_000209 [Actinomortierella wolfii]